jgi:hypothetical protein
MAGWTVRWSRRGRRRAVKGRPLRCVVVMLTTDVYTSVTSKQRQRWLNAGSDDSLTLLVRYARSHIEPTRVAGHTSQHSVTPQQELRLS